MRNHAGRDRERAQLRVKTDQAGNVGFARLSAHAAGEAATDDQETFLLKSS
jgi:hypothetical protein